DKGKPTKLHGRSSSGVQPSRPSLPHDPTIEEALAQLNGFFRAQLMAAIAVDALLLVHTGVLGLFLRYGDCAHRAGVPADAAADAHLGTHARGQRHAVLEEGDHRSLPPRELPHAQ